MNPGWADGRVVVAGAGGMLGRAVMEVLHSRGIAAIAATRGVLDLERPETIESAITPGTRTVINCAAWTDVDAAQEHGTLAFAVNAAGVERLARRCVQVGAKLVHFGTDYVFDGAQLAPHRVDHPRRPVNLYGRSKAKGEELLEASGCPHLLVRTSWLYAPWGKNFVRTIAQKAAQSPALRVVHDQRGRPTSALHLASATLALLDKDASGICHVTDGGSCSWFEFACEIVRQLGLPCSVEACTSEQFPRPAPRPAYSVLDISASEALLGAFPSWKSNLAAVIEQLRGEPPAARAA